MITWRSVASVAFAVALLMASIHDVAAQPGGLTGLDRAREAAVQSLDRANDVAPGQANRARGLDEERLRSLERAAEVRDRAQARGGNGRGNAFGRRAQLETSGDHSANVRLLVDAHNALRKTGPDRAD